MNSFTSYWSERRRVACGIAGGLMLAAAFPKIGVAGLAWIAPGVILLAALGARSPFRVGYAAGLAFHMAALHWLLFIPVSFYPILGWLALAGYLALYPAAWCWLCAKAEGDADSWSRRAVWALFCAVAWVALEMVQARLFSGFPWNLLGASQYRMVPLIQIASVAGEYGVAFLVVWFAAGLLLLARGLAREPANRLAWMGNLILPMLAAAVAYAAGLSKIMHTPASDRSLTVALVQPSIPQTLIWNESAGAARFEEVLKLSRRAFAAKPDLVIWPEGSVPSLPRWDTNLWRAITNRVVEGGAWLIFGADDALPRGPKEEDYFNSSFFVSPSGQLAAVYHKRRLVIFGEYVPLVRWLPFVKWFTPISGGFAEGAGPVPFDLPERAARLKTLICFEDVFPHGVPEYATPDTDFLVNITNDGWFKEGAAQWQHAANAVFRAVENGLPLVRCANNGLSCWIDAAGGMHDVYFDNSPDIYQSGVKIARVPLLPGGHTRPPTFYNQHGDWFGWGCVAVAGGFAAWQLRRRRG